MRLVLKFLLTMLSMTSPCRRVKAAQVTDADGLYTSIFANYNPKLFPLVNHTDTIYIQMFISIVSINQFDELSGEISVSLTFSLSWEEQRISWEPSDHSDQTVLLVAPEDIWRPQIFIIEASDRIEAIGNISLFLRLYHNGVVSWFPGKVVRSTCSVDVTNFPFDTQTCILRLIPWGIGYDEISLIPQYSLLNDTYFNSNSEWEVLESNILNYSLGASSCVELDLVLKRRSQFYVVYIIAPLAFLSVLNNFVFFMPANSGERMSVSVTTFLSFVVYMDIVNDNVPASSNPMSYLYYYLLFLMFYSCVTMFLCIESLRIYEKDGEIPGFVKRIVNCLRPGSCCVMRVGNIIRSTVHRKKHVRCPKQQGKVADIKVIDLESINNNSDSATPINHNVPETTTEPLNEELTWRAVGKTFDMYISLLLMIAYVSMTLYSYGTIYTNSSLIR